MSFPKNKILILPSWYATPEVPTSGSFFKEQAELMMDDFDIKVLVAEKRWISWRRFYYEKYIKRINRGFNPFFLDTPPTLDFEFDYIKFFSEEKNFDIMISCYISMVEKLISELNWKPELIHAYSSFQAGIIASELSEQFNIPYIITEHLGPFVLNKYNLFKRTQIIDSLTNANCVLAVSEHQKQHILMNGIDCNPIAVGNLVNDNLFKISSPKSGKFSLVFVAYYPNFIKDAVILFKALHLLKVENITITIVGGGELSGEYSDNYYQQLAKEFDVESMVHIIPKASRDEIKEIIEKSHVLVSTSIAESFGIAICEAMLCGKPVVITANGGCNDYLIDGVNGFKVPVKDFKSLADRILWVKENYNSFDANQIRAIIVSKYGEDTFKRKIANIYNATINEVEKTLTI